MHKLWVFISRLKWLGLLGLVGDLLGNAYLKLFWLLMLFGFIEIFRNLPVFFQGIEQFVSLPLIYIKHGFRLPSKGNYSCKNQYILPFEGKWTVVNGGVEKSLSHSWGIIPQRYAYDFLILDENGRSYRGDPKSVASYYCYGMNIVVPADGEVVCVNDKYTDSKVYADGTVDCSAGDIRGNFITIKHSDDEYSTIAHIMPGSILVTKGQRVRQGERIAKCGNTGNSSEPHVHFQLQDGKSFYASAGLPIKFSDITVTESAGYKLFDTRPLSAAFGDLPLAEGEKKIYLDYIHRGQTVENKELSTVNE